MAETQQDRTPTWVVFLAGALAAVLVAALVFGWFQMRGAAREVDLHVAPAATDLPTPRLPEAPRLPDAPIPTPK